MNVSKLIANRMARIDSSGIRKVFDLAKSIPNPINLSIGQPDYEMPEPVKAKAMQAIALGCGRYTVTQGTEELRQAVVEIEQARTGIRHDASIITAGVSGAIVLAFMALLNHGDRVILPDPYFVIYKHFCRLIGARPLYVDTYPDFDLTVERLEKAGAERGKVLVLNSPNNPTGQTLGARRLREIARWARANDVFIISDEIYSAFVYDGAPASVAKYTKDVLLMNGLSKSSAMPGWRLGYAIGPDDLIEQMATLQQYSFVCAPSIAQQAALVALRMDTTAHMQAYRTKRDIVYEGLKRKFELQEPKGAFYAFVRAPDGDGDAFCRKAIEHGCLVIPGSVFSEKKTHFRVAFAAPDETLEAGVRLLSSLA